MSIQRFLAVTMFPGLLFGCASRTASLPGPLEQPPLVTRIDAHVGLSIQGSARHQVAITPLVRIPVGEASASRFHQAFAAMFTSVVKLPDWPPWKESPPEVDGVIELAEVNMDAVFGDDLQRPDIVRVHYRVCLYEPDKAEVGCWTVDAGNRSQRTMGECLDDLSVCLSEQADAAMREAIARFLLDFQADSRVKAWAAGISIRP